MAVLLCAGLLHSCNPDCESIPGLRISADQNPAGYQVLLSANPPESLRGKKVFMGDREVAADFLPDAGLVFEVPPDVSGATEVRVEDGDCEQYAALDFQVVGADFFRNNPGFISPVPPEIVIPSIPPSFPPVIDNAWLSPTDIDYCMWFIMVKDTVYSADSSSFELVPTNTLHPAESFEFSTCGNADRLYHGNPMFGIIDRDLNYINIWVDRRSQGDGLGIEEYVGQFIPIEGTSFDKAYGGCSAGTSLDHNGYLMLLTSRRNGRQVLVFQKKP